MLTPYWKQYHVDVPEGVCGDHRVEVFDVTRAQAQLADMRSHVPRRAMQPGTYTRLCRGKWTTVMSDTPAEIFDHLELFNNAHGHVLLHGLGLGVALAGCLKQPAVVHVTVVEKSDEVITLVWDHYARRYGERVTLVHDNALTWQPPRGRRWNVVWHDIWDYITPENLPEMISLHRRFGRRADWQGSWCRALCERMR